MAASEDKLNKLHARLTDLFLEMVEEGGEDLPSATLKTMTAFLKDNEITCQDPSSTVGTLKDRLEQKKHLASVAPLHEDVAMYN